MIASPAPTIRAWPSIPAAAFLLFGGWLLAGGCSRPTPPAHQGWSVMGTWATLTVTDPNEPRLSEYTAECRKICESVDRAMSTYNPDSEISLLNRAAGVRAVPVSPATMDVLQASRLYGNLSRGRFDVTVGPLVRLWGFTQSTNPDQLPTPEQIRAVRELVGYAHLVLSNDTAFLDRPGMAVDLGGIAKGYAVDVCYRRLLEMGARNFMINLGGNIRCAGNPDRRSAWKIGVRNPFADATENGAPIIGTLQLTNGMAVSTSGNYERFVTIQGTRYAHIIDPVSGLPSSGIAGVTVLTTNATHSDGIDTGLFLLGLDGSRPVLAAMPGTEAIFIPDTPETPAVWLTPGLHSLFNPAADWTGKIHNLELPTAGPTPAPDQP